MKLRWLKYGFNNPQTLRVLGKRLLDYAYGEDFRLDVRKISNDEIQLTSLEKKTKKTVIFDENGISKIVENLSYERSEISIKGSPLIITVIQGGRSLRKLITSLSEASGFEIWIEPLPINPSVLLENIEGEVSVLGAKIDGVSYSKKFGGHMMISGEGQLNELLESLKKDQIILAIECFIRTGFGEFRLLVRSFGNVSVSRRSGIESQRVIELLTGSICEHPD